MEERNCSNCLLVASCKKAGEVCSGHVFTLDERLEVLHITKHDYCKFSKEWDEARHKLRKIGGLE